MSEQTIAELIKELEKLPQEKRIHCQVVGKKSGAWSMDFEFKEVSSSDWMVVLTVSHPALNELPMGDFK